MQQNDQPNLLEYLAQGRALLTQAAQLYERQLTSDDYWWLGVGLGAVTLAELSDKSYAVGRIEQLVNRLGHKGMRGDWLQRMVEELAELDAEGLLWPVYERTNSGPVEPVGVAISPRFDADAGYFLALAHIGIALAVHREETDAIAPLAGAIGEMVESGLQPEHEALILGALGENIG